MLLASWQRLVDPPVPTFSQPPPLTDSWYVVIGLPLGLAPLHATVTQPVSGVAPVIVGAPGGPAGTTALEAGSPRPGRPRCWRRR